jgi:hypothetical protein
MILVSFIRMTVLKFSADLTAAISGLQPFDRISSGDAGSGLRARQRAKGKGQRAQSSDRNTAIP